MGFNYFFTKENITFILATIGSIGTIYTLISAAIFQRVNFSMRLHMYHYKNNQLLIYASFENHSRLSLSITGISAIYDGVSYPCLYQSISVCEHERRIGGKIVSRKEDFSISLPINLSSLAGTSGYLYFDMLPDTYPSDAKTLTLQVSTNRGKAKKMILPVDC